MRKFYKHAIGWVVAAAVVAAAGGVYYLVEKYQKENTVKQEARIIKEHEAEVASYADKAFSDKWIMDREVSGMNADEMTAIFEEELAKYQDRLVSLTVDGEESTYTMEDLKEKIRYVCSDGTKFSPGEEKELAAKLIGIDKELSVEEQYLMILGETPATEEKVEITCSYSKKALNAVIEELQKKYIIPVTNAHIDAKGKISKTKNGQNLDTDTIKRELKSYLNSDTTDGFYGNYSTTVVEPQWTKKNLKKVNTVIASFQTTFVYTTARGHNIQVGASRVNGICLLPGESVSFDERVHDNSDGKKFRKANSYLQGQVVQSDGGGICQISTTAYNAILRAGILPEKRFPHSMPVHYVPLGLDAAISEGVKDLVIKNTLDVPILILAKTKKNVLSFEIKSYKNALGDYSYKPRAVQLSRLSAKAYLDVYKKGKKEKSILLHTDRYQEEQ
ncbi:MAG: VanW family protein [Lachnospiraceae bacterium]|nr:VanW family protein [Lachnospiraceae bacterium]